MAVPDYYQILGVLPSASTAEIKKAYRKLVHLAHPDKKQEGVHATPDFHKIQEAYKTLSDEFLRKRYDLERNYTLPHKAHRKYTSRQEYLQDQSYILLREIKVLKQGDLNYAGLVLRLNHLIEFYISEKHLLAEDVRESIAEIYLEAASRLPFRYWIELYPDLNQVGSQQPVFQARLQVCHQNQIKKNRLEKISPWLVVLGSLLVCLCM